MTTYRAVSWSDDELITAEKLNQMATNDKFLSERAMPQLYKAYGLNKTDGLRIACGIVTILSQAGAEAAFNVSFGGFFSQGCHPSIQATPAIVHPRIVMTSIKGLGPGNLRPDHTGFQVTINRAEPSTTNNNFPNNFHVHWMAIGY